MTINGQEYELHQVENDLFEFIDFCESNVGNFYTRYYDTLVYNTPQGFTACYADNHSNYWNI